MARKKGDPGSWRARDYSILAACFFPAAVLTWGIHEFAHWLMGVALGYDMWMTFNQAGLVQGNYDSVSHQLLVAMAGPAATWVQAATALVLIRRSHRLWAYSFLFLTPWMRGVAMCVSFLSKPNDEARAGLLLGLPIWVMPAVSVIFLVALTYPGSQSLRVGWKGNLVAYAMASLVTAIVVFSDQILFFST